MSADSNIRLVTFNIAHGRGLSPYQGFHSLYRLQRNLVRIAQFLQKNRIDVAALQEVDEDSHWNRRINLLEVLRDHTQLCHAVMGITNRRAGRKPLNYGNGLLSRHPIRSWDTKAFSSLTLGGKGFLVAEIEIHGQLLAIINLHLCFRSRKRRLVQVEQLVTFLNTYRHGWIESRLPPIICGDFNTEDRHESDAVRKIFDHVARDCDYQLLPRNQRTFPSFFPSRALDFILLPGMLRLAHCEVAPTYLSDHRPVIVEFELPGGAYSIHYGGKRTNVANDESDQEPDD